MQKSLDTKIANILADPSCKDFILADAKGRRHGVRHRVARQES